MYKGSKKAWAYSAHPTNKTMMNLLFASMVYTEPLCRNMISWYGWHITDHQTIKIFDAGLLDVDFAVI